MKAGELVQGHHIEAQMMFETIHSGATVTGLKLEVLSLCMNVRHGHGKNPKACGVRCSKLL